jgi:hypothetical protein
MIHLPHSPVKECLNSDIRNPDRPEPDLDFREVATLDQAIYSRKGYAG